MFDVSKFQYTKCIHFIHWMDEIFPMTDVFMEYVNTISCLAHRQLLISFIRQIFGTPKFDEQVDA